MDHVCYCEMTEDTSYRTEVWLLAHVSATKAQQLLCNTIILIYL